MFLIVNGMSVSGVRRGSKDDFQLKKQSNSKWHGVFRRKYLDFFILTGKTEVLMTISSSTLCVATDHRMRNDYES